MFSRDFEIPSPAHPMTAPVYLDYHQKATFLFVINGSPVRPENSGIPVGIGKVTRFGKRKIQPASFVNNAMTKRPARRPKNFGQAFWGEKNNTLSEWVHLSQGRIVSSLPAFSAGRPVGIGRKGCGWACGASHPNSLQRG